MMAKTPKTSAPVLPPMHLPVYLTPLKTTVKPFTFLKAGRVLLSFILIKTSSHLQQFLWPPFT